MDENRQRAYEDIACIRDILARTAADFKGLATFFITMGLIWCIHTFVCVGLEVWQIGVTARYMQGGTVDVLSQVGFISGANLVLSLVLYTALSVVYIWFRHRDPKRGINGLSQKLIGAWGACLFLYVSAQLIATLAIPEIMTALFRQTVEQKVIGHGIMYVDRCLMFVFPVLPILITSIFLENRRLLWIGIAAAVLVMLWIFVPATTVSLKAVQGDVLWEMVWKLGLAMLIRFVPAAALLAFGQNLKKT